MMHAAARVTDQTTLGGVIIGPGNSSVLIGGLPAAVTTDSHVYGPTPLVSNYVIGSSSVKIGTQFALRKIDVCTNGASPVLGLPSVQIG